MNETRRKPTTGRQSPSLFDKWHGIFYMPSRIDEAGHTKVFDYPVTHTRRDIPRPLITQSHTHGGTYQGIWLPSHTDTAWHTKAFDCPVTQTRLDIPRSLITQSHRHGWTYQDLWLPSHTDTAGHTKAFDYPVTQTRLDIPRPLITQSHRHGWTYQGLWLPSHTDTAGHTKVFDYPVTQTRLDIPRPLITQSWSTGGKAEMFSGTRTDNASVTVQRAIPVSQPGSPIKPFDELWQKSLKNNLRVLMISWLYFHGVSCVISILTQSLPHHTSRCNQIRMAKLYC